jgi:hypothetical protein
MGLAGATQIATSEDKRLLQKWKYSSLAPATAEEDTSISRVDNKLSSCTNFCPEVSFDIFGVFASYLHRYADEIDTDLAHQNLGYVNASPDDWRWRWSSLRELHYTECPMYSLLMLPEKRSVPFQLSVAGYEILKISISPWWSKFVTAKFFNIVERMKGVFVNLRNVPAGQKTTNSIPARIGYFALPPA